MGQRVEEDNILIFIDKLFLTLTFHMLVSGSFADCHFLLNRYTLTLVLFCVIRLYDY